jgi:hypothetical protein
MKNFTSFFILFFLFSPSLNAATGCKVPGSNIIYPNSNYYLLGVKVNGVTIGVGQNVYNLTSPVYTDVSCVVPWANSYQLTGSGVCIYGSPAVAVPLVVSLCGDCVYGELVDYTTTTECNLDDYSWTLGAAAGFFGIFVIRRRNKP